MRERQLVWDGCLNVRDLGGFPTDDGGETAWGRVVRSDSVHFLTGAGIVQLTSFGVSSVLDLRSHGERLDDPAAPNDALGFHVSVHPEAGDPFWAELDELAGDAESRMAAFYVESVRRWGDRFADAVRVVAEAPDGATVIHCQGGRDRTGIVVALLLRLAGVSIDEIAADYAVSAANLEPRWSPWVNEARDEDDRARRLLVSETPAPSMCRFLGELEREHGSVAEFLLAHELSDETLDLARRRLRG